MDEGPEQEDCRLGGTAGGIVSDPQVEKLAAAALAGMDPMMWLRTESEVELKFLDRIADEAIKLHRTQRQELADRIIGSLDKAMKRGKQNQKG